MVVSRGGRWGKEVLRVGWVVAVKQGESKGQGHRGSKLDSGTHRGEMGSAGQVAAGRN